MLVLIDNYDSFVHNLARYCGELGCETEVLRNDETTVDAVLRRKPAAIIISPGPCTPTQAGISERLIRQCAGKVPLLGVCLGHQAIASALGGKVIRASKPVHGQTTMIQHDGTGLFHGLASPLRVMRYHSLIIDEATLPDGYRVIARTSEGTPMAIAHGSEPVFGVQFHPEAVLTDSGHRLLANFLEVAGVEYELPASTELTGQIDLGLWDQDFDRPWEQ